MASSRQQQGSKQRQQAADDKELDPSYDWQENADYFVLRIHLTDFRKQDFKVQVDGAGRLTVRGQRTDAADARHSRLNKVFQLPATANLEDISGRFEAGVLTLTVPKKGKQQQQQPQPPQEVAESSKPTPPPPKKDKDGMGMATKTPSAPGKPVEEATTNTKKPGAAEQVQAKGSEPPVQDQCKAATPAGSADKQKDKDQAAAAPPAEPDSLVEMRAKRRAEEEAAKPPAATAAEEAPPRRGFTFRELQGLAASDWAEGLLDTVKKNREVIAVAVAAFSLGLFVSSRLCSTSRN